MISKDSFNSASTHVEVMILLVALLNVSKLSFLKLSCIPEDTTGLERIMLAAQGDLQRLMRFVKIAWMQ